MLEKADRLIYDGRGELAVIVQYAYTLAAARVQPVIRGALTRLKIPGVRREVLSIVSSVCAGRVVFDSLRRILLAPPDFRWMRHTI